VPTGAQTRPVQLSTRSLSTRVPRVSASRPPSEGSEGRTERCDERRIRSDPAAPEAGAEQVVDAVMPFVEVDGIPRVEFTHAA